MLATGAKRMISTTTQVYPPIHQTGMSSVSAFTTRRRLGNIRWVPTIFALELICVFAGYGVSAYRRNRIEKYYAQSAEMERQEAESRARNIALMDAYGDKSSLGDLQKAIAAYESQQRQQ